MSAIRLQFVFPTGLKAKKTIAKLADQAVIEAVSQQSCFTSYYDSFDWRLYKADIVCAFEHCRKTSILSLSLLADTTVLATAPLNQVPAFADQFPPGKLHDLLQPLLEMRALLPICTLEHEVQRFNLLNKDQKTVARLKFEAFESIPARVTVIPIRGYEKAASKISRQLLSIGLKPIQKPALYQALKIQGRKPGDYSAKLDIRLQPDMDSYTAARQIFSSLLHAIKINENGTLNAIDSEFLHDFRVAIRRTRAGLSQIKGVLPAEDCAKFSDFFAWLGQITGPNRDMDVYLLNFPAYKNSLPVSLREDLNPLQTLLIKKQKAAHRQLVKQLKTDKYLNTLKVWEKYLKQPTIKSESIPNAETPIKNLADRRIWRIYKRILKDGGAICDHSPAEALHDLRKTCKKLRYLMEFFQSLYDPAEIKKLIKALKGFQEVLGDFQDYEIQENTLRKLADEMIHAQVPSATFLVMGVLIQNMDRRRCQARNDFNDRFAAFNEAQNKRAFKTLFATEKIVRCSS